MAHEKEAKIRVRDFAAIRKALKADQVDVHPGELPVGMGGSIILRLVGINTRKIQIARRNCQSRRAVSPPKLTSIIISRQSRRNISHPLVMDPDAQNFIELHP